MRRGRCPDPGGANSGCLAPGLVLLKVLPLLFGFVWLRATMPRLRYDQFMRFGWKVLIPINLVWILVLACVRYARRTVQNTHSCLHRNGPAGRGWPGGSGHPARNAEVAVPRGAVAAPSAGDFPLPPMDLEVPPSPRAPRAVADRAARTRRRPTPGHERKANVGDIDDSFKGFGVTFAHMFNKVVTADYPFTPPKPAPRYHGRHILNRHPDGLEKCVGCELCAWACPADAIYVEGASNTDDNRFSPASGTRPWRIRSTTPAASSAGCASKPARPVRSP